MKKAILTLFIFICLMATIYSGYLLFNKEIEPIPGSVILALGVIVCIWSWSLARKRKYQLSGGAVAAAVIIITVLASATGAYAGYEPLVEAKDKVASIFEGSGEGSGQKDKGIKIAPRDMYLIPPTGTIGNWRQGNLFTIKEWEGKGAKDISFSIDKSPWVLNAGYKGTSQISVNFDVQVQKEISGLPPGVKFGLITRTAKDISAVTVEEKGKFTIDVNASGCEWWVRVGTEN